MERLRIVLASVGESTIGFPFVSPPMGLLYLAAYLREKLPVDILLINQRVEGWTEEELSRRIVEYRPDAVGLSALTVCGHMLCDVAQRVRQLLPSAFMVIGGPHASSVGVRALKETGADAVVVGEGELSLEAVLRARFEGGDMSSIAGLIWRTPEGDVVSNPGRMPVIEDLDSLPFPAYDLIDLSKYWTRKSITPLPTRKYVSLVSSRGCPYHCIWCHSIFGKRFRAHSAERIVDEVEYFTRKYNIEHVEFLDDIFNLDRDRVIQFSEGIRRRGLKFRFSLPNGVRTDLLTEEVVDALVDAGLYYSGFALETGSPRLQELTGKHLNIPRFLDGLQMAVRRGVFTYGFAMLGHPTETEAELQQTIDTLTGSAAHIASFFRVIPFPGTPLHEMVRQQCPERLQDIEYYGASFGTISANVSAVPEEMLFEYHRKAYRTFYLNSRRMLRILRHYPRPLELATYVPILLRRIVGGLRNGSDVCTAEASKRVIHA